MAKKTVNSDIYNLSQLVDDVKAKFIPSEPDETLAMGTYGYIGAVESSRLQTQVQMTGELCNEVFPSRARLERNIITHAIMANIENINAVPAKMNAFLALKESDIIDHLDPDNIFTIDRECPLYIGDYEFHLEYDIKLKRILVKKKEKASYSAWYEIPSGREVPNSSITTQNQYLAPPAVVFVGSDPYVYLTVTLSQVEHVLVSKKLVTSNIIDNKTINFEFDNQLAYFEVHCQESSENYYLTPVFEGSSVPETGSKYYCWYQYIDTNLIRIRFDRKSYMPGLNANVECLIKTCQGAGGNFTYGQDTFIDLSYEPDDLAMAKYGYSGVTALLTPITDSSGGKDRKSKKELQSLIPKEALSRGSLTTITDLNNYFSMLDSEYGRIVIQKKIDNQIERVYYAYFVAKDQNGDVIPTNTIDVKVGLEDLIESRISESDSVRYILPSGTVFRLGDDGIGYVNHLPLIGSGQQFTPKAVSRGSIIEDIFTVEETDDVEDLDSVSCAVDVGGCPTSTHVFPSETEEDRFKKINCSETTTVEDYIQMGVGKNYLYTADYITKEDNSVISVRDKNLQCFDFEEAYYTANGVTKQFNSLPIVAYNFPKDTKIKFAIKRKLNEKVKGIITFSYDGKTYKLHQSMITNKLSTILNSLGISAGEVTEAISSDDSILKVIETGTIGPGEEPIIPPNSSSEEDPSPNPMSNLENPYTLTVDKVENLPDIKDRKENEWFYAIKNSKERPDGQETSSNLGSTGIADTYKLHVANESELPPVEEREEDNWYYAITGVTEREDIPDDPDVPDDPGELTGKEYRLEFLDNFETPVSIVATVGNGIYEISLSQDRFNIENGLYITESGTKIGIETQRTIYKTFTPVLDQDVWPDDLNPGDRIVYRLRYKSISNTYTPVVTIKLSDGLKYVLFSNTITYPDGTSYALEPTSVSMESERGFIYTNPYAANVNGYRLYSSFYMMSMDENPYLNFEVINDKSNVQFIATNARWTRVFSGNEKDQYKLSITVTQSVQEDIGLVPPGTDVPLARAFAVFKRGGKDYRYRSLNLESFDPSTYELTFSQKFDSLDVFDNDSNIKVTNVQVAGQQEYTVALRYGEKEYLMNHGAVVNLSDAISDLEISISSIKAADSSNQYALAVYPVYNDEGTIILDYKIASMTDFAEEEHITIVDDNGNETVINAISTQPAVSEYGFFEPNTDVKIYILCAVPDVDGNYSKGDSESESICPGLDNWTLTNTYKIVNGVTMYHNYSEIMGSRVKPYGKDVTIDGNVTMQLEGYYIDSIPMIGFDYSKDDILIQSAINALNYRKAYIDSATTLLENSFGIDFKLFNTYGPSNTYYVIDDKNSDYILDDGREFIDRVNLTFYFRIKLVAENDSYTRDNIVAEIKEYVEDLEDLSELHIPNLVTQITNNYKEQISYFEYLGFNNYGPNIQHIYKLGDKEIPIHVAPEFLCVNNKLNGDGTTSPDINIFISEI